MGKIESHFPRIGAQKGEKSNKTLRKEIVYKVALMEKEPEQS